MLQRAVVCDSDEEMVGVPESRRWMMWRGRSPRPTYCTAKNRGVDVDSHFFCRRMTWAEVLPSLI